MQDFFVNCNPYFNLLSLYSPARGAFALDLYLYEAIFARLVGRPRESDSEVFPRPWFEGFLSLQNRWISGAESKT